jgi:hypothetical protein
MILWVRRVVRKEWNIPESTNSSKSFGDCPEVLNEFEPVISPSQPVHL